MKNFLEMSCPFRSLIFNVNHESGATNSAKWHSIPQVSKPSPSMNSKQKHNSLKSGCCVINRLCKTWNTNIPPSSANSLILSFLSWTLLRRQCRLTLRKCPLPEVFCYQIQTSFSERHLSFPNTKHHG